MEPAKEPDDSGDIVSPSSPERMAEDNPAVPEELQPVDENIMEVEDDGEESGGISTPSSGISKDDAQIDIDGDFLLLANSSSVEEIIFIIKPGDSPSPKVALAFRDLVASRNLPLGDSAQIIIYPSSVEVVPTEDAKEETKEEITGETKDEITGETKDEITGETKDEIKDETKDEELLPLALAPNNKRGV
ncbi:uncharacterized protein TNIN_18561 [Trichonephila inaurata madagascariensis]|uniref:Uncharacterized protein n=1 Tax=Trichonephila inaurata madagascariensis TaxID=2747483 RepID=A0A8X7CUT5_9ARAC|nr:uncharacterized protein TNIN_18561 [Trichonephila inaurata madagascariensis]